ncbi:MaoC family dehydratase [Kribbella sp. NBC_00382]|uniref:MaoC family dehydratase n=1 Tax=Kribbella sp. NBC_00382 TaxID=2975967 RepID=UPI002E2094A6
MNLRTRTGPLQLTTSELKARLGGVIGHSEWRAIEQADANAFGAATHDEQWIHTDPIRAAQGPFGRTIAHGYLTLSLATALVDEVLDVSDAVMVVNYGVDRVRFPAPLPLGAQVRAEVGLSAIRDFPGGVQATLHLVYEVADQEKPCCVADVLLRYYVRPELVSS